MDERTVGQWSRHLKRPGGSRRPPPGDELSRADEAGAHGHRPATVDGEAVEHAFAVVGAVAIGVADDDGVRAEQQQEAVEHRWDDAGDLERTIFRRL